jgi:hypothetical protein
VPTSDSQLADDSQADAFVGSGHKCDPRRVHALFFQGALGNVRSDNANSTGQRLIDSPVAPWDNCCLTEASGWGLQYPWLIKVRS